MRSGLEGNTIKQRILVYVTYIVSDVRRITDYEQISIRVLLGTIF